LAAANEKFEPLHGTGPDSLGNREAATAIDEADRHVISQGQTTPDIGGSFSTTQVGDAIRG